MDSKDKANANYGPGRRIPRRKFLAYSAYAGAVGAVSPSLLRAGTAKVPVRATPTSPFPLEEVTIAQMQKAMTSGKTTSVELVNLYLQRIQEVDQDPHGPQLNSVLETNPDAIAIAGLLDREREEGHVRGPLHGIPILLKDNVATDDRMESTAGSYALLGSRPPRDAYVAAKLRQAGAVLLGKLNLSEWANFRGFQSSSGWSGRAGQCLNPFVLDRSPCGSSSGSGAAVSGNLGAASIGTETDGSIVCPSGANGILGIKPTLGLTSRSGVVPIAHSQDVTGPMARTVADAAAVLGALTGVDPRDRATFRSVGHSFEDYTQFLDPNGLRGARIGVWREGVFGISPEGDRVAEEAISVMSKLGATIVDPADIPNVADVFDPEFTVLLFEFKVDMRRYLKDLVTSQVRSLEGCIDFNNAHVEEELKWFGQEIFELAEATDGLGNPDYQEALKTEKTLMIEGINGVMDKHDLDAIVSLTGEPPWTIDLVNGDHFQTASSTPAAVAGFPNISVPGGYAFGELPVGISFIGRAWSEPTLIKLTSGFEAGTNVRHAPRFIPTLGVKEYVPRGAGRR